MRLNKSVKLVIMAMQCSAVPTAAAAVAVPLHPFINWFAFNYAPAKCSRKHLQMNYNCQGLRLQRASAAARSAAVELLCRDNRRHSVTPRLRRQLVNYLLPTQNYSFGQNHSLLVRVLVLIIKKVHTRQQNALRRRV